MIEIKLEELSDWFEKKTRKKTNPIKKETEKKLSKCKSIFDELKIACRTLEEQQTPSSDELIIKSAKRFSAKLIDRLDNVGFPEKISYEDLEKFESKLEHLLESVAQDANRWVSKLGREKAYLQSIRDINYLLKDIYNFTGKLKNFLEKKYREVQNMESIEDLILRLIELRNDVTTLKNNESEIKNELAGKEKEFDQINDKIEELLKDGTMNQLNTVEKDIEKLNGKIRNLIGPIRKPLKKFSKLLESGEFTARAGAGSYANSYLYEPVTTFLSEGEDFPNLRAVLLDLIDAINTNKLKLKTGSEKKIKSKISEVDSKDLREIKNQFEHLTNKKRALLSNPEYEKKILVLEEMNQTADSLKRELEDIKVKLDKNIEDYNKSLYKIGDYKTKIENSIFEAINIQIKLLL